MEDPGLANERTALAWQRTALATAAGAAILVRLRLHERSVVTVWGLGAALVLAMWILLESRARYRHHRRARDRMFDRGGIAPLALSTAVALLAMSELVPR
jgi:uncharacterized membrane protein YidH (DUF202 family)